MSRNKETHNRKYFPSKVPVRVFLACGCVVRTRVVPFPSAAMGCTSGLGHGYRLRWVRAIDENGHEFFSQKAGE